MCIYLWGCVARAYLAGVDSLIPSHGVSGIELLVSDLVASTFLYPPAHVTALSCHLFETGSCSVAQVGLGFRIGTLLPQPSQVFHMYIIVVFWVPFGVEQGFLQ